MSEISTSPKVNRTKSSTSIHGGGHKKHLQFSAKRNKSYSSISGFGGQVAFTGKKSKRAPSANGRRAKFDLGLTSISPELELRSPPSLFPHPSTRLDQPEIQPTTQPMILPATQPTPAPTIKTHTDPKRNAPKEQHTSAETQRSQLKKTSTVSATVEEMPVSRTSSTSTVKVNNTSEQIGFPTANLPSPVPAPALAPAPEPAPAPASAQRPTRQQKPSFSSTSSKVRAPSSSSITGLGPRGVPLPTPASPRSINSEAGEADEVTFKRSRTSSSIHVSTVFAKGEVGSPTTPGLLERRKGGNLSRSRSSVSEIVLPAPIGAKPLRQSSSLSLRSPALNSLQNVGQSTAPKRETGYFSSLRKLAPSLSFGSIVELSDPPTSPRRQLNFSTPANSHFHKSAQIAPRPQRVVSKFTTPLSGLGWERALIQTSTASKQPIGISNYLDTDSGISRTEQKALLARDAPLWNGGESPRVGWGGNDWNKPYGGSSVKRSAQASKTSNQQRNYSESDTESETETETERDENSCASSGDPHHLRHEHKHWTFELIHEAERIEKQYQAQGEYRDRLGELFGAVLCRDQVSRQKEEVLTRGVTRDAPVIK